MQSVAIGIAVVCLLSTLQTRAFCAGTLTLGVTITAPSSGAQFSDSPGARPINVAATFTYTISDASPLTNYFFTYTESGGSDGSTAFNHPGSALLGTDGMGFVATSNPRSGNASVTFPNGGPVNKTASASTTVANVGGGLAVDPVRKLKARKSLTPSTAKARMHAC